MAEKESLAMSLEGNHEDKINRIVKLEDRIAELLKAAKEHEEQCGKEKSELKSKLHQAELISQENLKPLQESLEVKEDAYRLVIVIQCCKQNFDLQINFKGASAPLTPPHYKTFHPPKMTQNVAFHVFLSHF